MFNAKLDYDARNWHWSVRGTNEVYSSRRGVFVAEDDAEVAALPYLPTRISRQDLARIRIELLELKVTPRRLREAVLTPEGKAWLEDIEDQIEVLRNSLE